MSKFLNIFLPALGGAAIDLGVAFGMASRNYQSQEVDAVLSKAEAAEILEKANARASQIVNDATSKAETEAEKILTSASKTIENDVNKAKEELRQKMSELIIETSEKILCEEITPDKHQELLAKAASEL